MRSGHDRRTGLALTAWLVGAGGVLLTACGDSPSDVVQSGDNGQVEDASKPSDGGQIKDTSKPSDGGLVEDTSKPSDGGQAEETSKPGDGGQAEGASNRDGGADAPQIQDSANEPPVDAIQAETGSADASMDASDAGTVDAATATESGTEAATDAPSDAAADANAGLDAEACANACALGMTECQGNALATCVAGASGCTVWGTPVTCTTNVANAAASCPATTCGFTCNANYVPDNGACVPPASRPISPLTGNMVSTRAPTLTWMLPTGFTGAQVDVCADRACTTVLWTSATVTGTSSAPSSVTVGLSLPTALTFWRVVTMNGAQRGTLASPTWQFQTAGSHSAPLMTSWPLYADIEGDGYADLVIQDTNGVIAELPGSSTGIVTTPKSSFSGPGSLIGTGDVNGDGFSDVVVNASGTSLSVFPGTPTGYASTPTYTATLPSGTTPMVAGDVNGDGYADVAMFINSASWSLAVFPGSPSGFGTATTPIAGPDPSSIPDGNIEPVGDVNNDGYADVLVPNRGFNSSAGRVYLYLGGPTGLVSPPAKTFNPPAGARQFGGYGGAFSGQGGADVNGDGYIDLFFFASMVANPAQTVLYVYYGAPGGFDAVAPPSATLPLGTSAAYIYPAGGGDVNGDGYGDVLAVTGAGVLVFRGGPGALALSPYDTLLGSNAVPVSTSWAQNHHLGVIGDVNGDGRSDFATGIVYTAYSTVVYHGATGAIPQAPVLNIPLYPASYTLQRSIY